MVRTGLCARFYLSGVKRIASLGTNVHKDNSLPMAGKFKLGFVLMPPDCKVGGPGSDSRQCLFVTILEGGEFV